MSSLDFSYVSIYHLPIVLKVVGEVGRVPPGDAPVGRQRMLRGGLFALCACALAGGGVLVEPVRGQLDTDVWRPFHTDAYGNARAWYPERRPMGSFSNEIQLQATRGFQLEGRRQSYRGADAYFRLPGQVLPRMGQRPEGWVPGFGKMSRAMSAGFAYYGGFADRRRVPA